MMRLQKTKFWILSFCTGATAFQFSGCDPSIRDTVFQGVQSSTVGLVTTFINALFLAIQPTTEETATTTKAIIETVVEHVHTLC